MSSVKIVYIGKEYTIKTMEHNDKYIVYEFLRMRTFKEQERMFRLFEQIADTGKTTNITQFRHLGDQIYEFKRDQMRILCFYDSIDKSLLRKSIVLTHGFIKKTQKTPRGEIERAQKYRNLFYSNELSEKLLRITSKGDKNEQDRLKEE